MLNWLRNFARRTDGAVTAEWVVLTAATVLLLGAGYGYMRDGTTELSDGVESYMLKKQPGEF